MGIKLEAPELRESRPRLTVIGVGGAGCNAINNMIEAGLKGVNFVVANTDAQSLATAHTESRVQLGAKLTEGLGAGSKPEIGEAAAEEAVEELKHHLAGSHMVFVAAGMGGGTGTGAAGVIARVAKDLGILTVGVVTKPFLFEGARRMRVAEAGVAELKKYVDTLIVIPNQNLFRLASEKTTFAEAFLIADQVLYGGIACIVDLIIKEGLINLDFADVRTIMAGMGSAVMGQGEASGERRATRAAEEALSNPLLDDISLKGAKGLLLSITGSPNLTLYEVDEAASRVRQEVDPDANIIVGATFDEELVDSVRVSIVASGIARAGEQQRPVQQSATARASEAPKGFGVPFDPQLQSRAAEAATRNGDVQRRLSEALQLQAPVPPPLPGRDDPLGHGPRETWRAPGNVLIEQVPPQLSASVPQPPPLPPGHGPGPYGGHQGFTPAPAAEIRRPLRRMPDLEDFPAIGQRAYRALTGPPDASSPYNATAGEPAHAAPPRRRGLFERITGRMRRQDEEQFPAQTKSWRGQGSEQGYAREAREDDRQDINSQEQQFDIPVFFSHSKKRI